MAQEFTAGLVALQSSFPQVAMKAGEAAAMYTQASNAENQLEKVNLCVKILARADNDLQELIRLTQLSQQRLVCCLCCLNGI